jgi:hypothetical protein
MDAILCALVVLAAVAFLARRFRGRRSGPKGQPKVIIGARLAKAMKR